jgi:tetratricopeptide (TPR) repeat protein
MSNLPDFMKLWDYNKPAETEKEFRKLLPQAEKSKDTVYLIELSTQIARTQGLQMKFDEAHKTLDKIMKMIGPEHIRPRIRFLLERGRVYNSSKVYDKAAELFEAAYQQAVKYGEDNYAIDAAHMMAIVEKGGESLKWNEIAMNHAENTKDEKAKNWLGSLYNNTAWTYHDMGEFGKAYDLFEKQVQFFNERDSKPTLAIAKWCVAKCLRSMGKVEEALSGQMELKDWMEKEGLERDGYNSEEIGECLLILDKGEESKPYFKNAYEKLSQDIWLAENDKERLERLKKLGE